MEIDATQITWSRSKGYECSSKGDTRFSAFYAKLPDNRTIEMWYQCDIKGYDVGGTNWRLGKGKPPLMKYPNDGLYELYKSLWRLWSIHHPRDMMELLHHAQQNNNSLSDMFATTPVNQARALSEILNEWFV